MTGYEEDEEQMRMEIMLGMEQEEGVPCLLCVMPRCLCNITLDLTKLKLKLKELEGGGREASSQEPPGTDGFEDEMAVAEGVLEDGNLGGPLEGEGLTSNEEGSFTPQGPAGVPESLHTFLPENDEEGEATSVHGTDRKEAEEAVQDEEGETAGAHATDRKEAEEAVHDRKEGDDK